MVLCTEPFIPTAKSMPRIQGIPDCPFVAMQHPLGSLRPEEVKERAAKAMPKVMEILMRQKGT